MTWFNRSEAKILHVIDVSPIVFVTNYMYDLCQSGMSMNLANNLCKVARLYMYFLTWSALYALWLEGLGQRNIISNVCRTLLLKNIVHFEVGNGRLDNFVFLTLENLYLDFSSKNDKIETPCFNINSITGQKSRPGGKQTVSWAGVVIDIAWNRLY